MRRRVDGDVALLHALEQAGLRLRRGAVDLVDDHDVGEDRAGAELEARLALVVDVGADDVGRQQVGRALHARELAVDRARERARQRGLADARVVLDEDVALGEQRDDHVLEDLVADLDGAADVVRDAARDGDRGVDLGRCARPSGAASSRGSIQRRTFMSVDERRLKTASRIAAGDLGPSTARGTCRSSSGGDDPDLVVGGVEADAGAADVVDDDGVEVLAGELVAAVGERALAVLGGEADEQLAGAAAGGERRTSTSCVRTRRRFSSAPVWSFLSLPACAAGRPVVGDGGGHQQHVGTRRSARRRRRRARRRSPRRRSRCPRGAGARRWRRRP